jgi:hypothetical protein|eukprot:COSAG01_NODE_3361_length_6199_cov_4.450492_6_plen_68_part_00
MEGGRRGDGGPSRGRGDHRCYRLERQLVVAGVGRVPHLGLPPSLRILVEALHHLPGLAHTHTHTERE